MYVSTGDGIHFSSFGNFFGDLTLSFGNVILGDNFFILISSSGKNVLVSITVSIPFILVSFALIKGLVTFDSGDNSKSLSFNSSL